MSTSKFCTLAQELLDQICAHLGDVDLHSLHHVSHSLFEGTKKEYSKRNFKDIHVREDLQLKTISQQPRYAEAVEGVTISTFALQRPQGTTHNGWRDSDQDGTNAPVATFVDIDVPAALQACCNMNYTKLSRVDITNVMIPGAALITFFTFHRNTALRAIALQHIYLEWTDDTEHPWLSVFKALLNMYNLESLWLNCLAALKLGVVPHMIAYYASQEVPWTPKINVDRALTLLEAKYTALPEDCNEIWVDLDYIMEQLAVQYGVY
ncbi:hypothetical protein BU23DRAFT_645990 [Bimuria novae-zelandiae CBS 107.79]|uniref:F-box domain-containing protein n=1 Tax=Bimuria novae-zelandiae CBS 107.79 TaxID=1447943 RepID=A0A6A5V2U5_9PLEO|nr:hypothetical protein BU23DRAFT_645990 [Bimuria novae-zelandiae CBS 107.79]